MFNKQRLAGRRKRDSQMSSFMGEENVKYAKYENEKVKNKMMNTRKRCFRSPKMELLGKWRYWETPSSAFMRGQELFLLVSFAWQASDWPTRPYGRVHIATCCFWHRFWQHRLKKKKKKYLCMCGRGLSLKGLITIDSFLLAPCEQIWPCDSCQCQNN